MHQRRRPKCQISVIFFPDSKLPRIGKSDARQEACTKISQRACRVFSPFNLIIASRLASRMITRSPHRYMVASREHYPGLWCVNVGYCHGILPRLNFTTRAISNPPANETCARVDFLRNYWRAPPPRKRKIRGLAEEWGQFALQRFYDGWTTGSVKVLVKQTTIYIGKTVDVGNT